MPVKKGARSARSTRTTKASSKTASSDLVLDENVATPVDHNADKKKSSKPAAALSKKVLGERNAPNDHPSSTQTSARSSKSSAKPSKSQSKSSTIEKVEETSRATTPIPSSPSKKRLPEEQVQAFLQNYDLEAETRISRLRASLELSVQSSLTRMKLCIDRIPRAIRELSMAEFWDGFGGDIHAVMDREPSHLKDTQEEWDQIREERSPAKDKRARKNDPSSSASRSTSSAASKKKPTRSAKGSSRPPTSPLAPSSGKAAPSLATFKPDLPKQALQTPKPQPRMARPGEMVQWQSINGSPICGIIGEDGVVRPVTFA